MAIAVWLTPRSWLTSICWHSIIKKTKKTTWDWTLLVVMLLEQARLDKWWKTGVRLHVASELLLLLTQNVSHRLKFSWVLTTSVKMPESPDENPYPSILKIYTSTQLYRNALYTSPHYSLSQKDYEQYGHPYTTLILRWSDDVTGLPFRWSEHRNLPQVLTIPLLGGLRCEKGIKSSSPTWPYWPSYWAIYPCSLGRERDYFTVTAGYRSFTIRYRSHIQSKGFSHYMLVSVPHQK
jgi:hypothetical protein